MGDSEGSEEKTLGTLSAVFLIGNAAVGAGVLNFPEAFMFAGGAVLAMVLQVLLILFVVLGLIALAVLTIRLNVDSMQDIMLLTCGKCWHIYSVITITLYSFFCSVAYHIVIGDQFDRVLYNLSGPDFCHTWYLNRKFTIIAASTLFMFPFLFPKKIDFLKYISHVGVTAILYVICLVVVKYFVGDYPKGLVLWVPKDFLKVSMTIPPFCFAYHVHIQSVPVFSCLKDSSMKALLFICFSAMFVCLILYSLTGTFGYMTFGNLVKSNILVNYSANDAFVVLAILIVALKICCVYPVVCFCGRDAAIDIYLEITKGDREKNNLLRRVIAATIWFILAVALALLFPDIGVVIDVLGCLVAFFMFVFPGLALLMNTKEQDSSDKKAIAVSVLLIVLGIIVAIMSFVIVVWRLCQGNEEHQLLCH